MAEAFAWGALASSSLLIGALIALRVSVGNLALGLVMAFGSGVLISAVAYELALEAAWGKLVGLVTTLGSALAFAVSAFE